MRILIALSVTAALLGCAQLPNKRPPVNLMSTFDEAQARELIKAGTGIVSGTAFLRQNGGGVVTCAGSKVTILPATKYSSERLSVIYGDFLSTGKTSFASAFSLKHQPQQFDPDPPGYYAATKSTTCDAQGNFLLEDIQDGDYFVVTNVTWTVRSIQGGTLATKVTVKNSKSPKLIMTIN